MRKWVLPGSGALAALVLSGCASQPAQPQAMDAPAGRNSLQFACVNGEKVEMQFDAEQGRGVLLRGGWAVTLPQQAAESGYAFSNGPTTVQGNSRELTIQIGHLAPIWCRSRPTLVAGVR